MIKALAAGCIITVVYTFVMLCIFWANGTIKWDPLVFYGCITASIGVFWLFHWPGTSPDDRSKRVYVHLLFALAHFEIMYLLFSIALSLHITN